MTDLSPVSQILLEARALLSSPSKWTRTSLAKGADKFSVNPYSPFATCWCLDGALIKAFKTLRFPESAYDDAMYVLAREIDPKGGLVKSVVWDWNDDPSRTYEEVVALLEAAILRERAKRDSQGSSEGLS